MNNKVLLNKTSLTEIYPTFKEWNWNFGWVVRTKCRAPSSLCLSLSVFPPLSPSCSVRAGLRKVWELEAQTSCSWSINAVNTQSLPLQSTSLSAVVLLCYLHKRSHSHSFSIPKCPGVRTNLSHLGSSHKLWEFFILYVSKQILSAINLRLSISLDLLILHTMKWFTYFNYKTKSVDFI